MSEWRTNRRTKARFPQGQPLTGTMDDKDIHITGFDLKPILEKEDEEFLRMMFEKGYGRRTCPYCGGPEAYGYEGFVKHIEEKHPEEEETYGYAFGTDEE